MTAQKNQSLKKKTADIMRCFRCNGRMVFEKFYDVNNVFYGWHCVICGEIVDPVILLHRLSQDADIRIPEKEEEVLSLIKKLLSSKGKDLSGAAKQGASMIRMQELQAKDEGNN
jgi:hypothetical protein